MLCVIIGASGTGKTSLTRELVKSFNYKEIVSYTTRPKRESETDDVDYHFVSIETFCQMIGDKCFLEYEEYSQNRFYGTSLRDVEKAVKSSEKYVIVLTPNGYRKIIQEFGSNADVFSVLLITPLGERVKRYIDRCGVESFSFDDMNEINARVNRDFGMFMGLENAVNMVLENKSNTDLNFLAQKIDAYYV